MRTLMMLALTILLFTRLPRALAQTDWEVVKKFQIGGEGGWDYLTVDPQTHRLYVLRTTHTMVIDTETGKTIADIPDQKNAHGVALAPKAGQIDSGVANDTLEVRASTRCSGIRYKIQPAT